MRKGFKKTIATVMAAVMLLPSQLTLPVKAAEDHTEQKNAAQEKIVYRTTYADPQSGNNNWRQGSVTGNGENALIESGNPVDDVMIFQNIKFNYPNSLSREVPKLSEAMEDAKQTILTGGNPVNDFVNAGTDWLHSVGIEESWELRWTYSFHPAHQLRLTMEDTGYDGSSYRGYTNYETAEIGTTWTDESGKEWERKSFSSREDNVTITSLKSQDGGKINMNLSVDNITDMRDENAVSKSQLTDMRYKKVVDKENASYIGEVAHYPDYQYSDLVNGGFAGITRVIVKGGSKSYVEGSQDVNGDEFLMNIGEDKNPMIRIADAEEVILITKSDRDLEMGEFSAFTQTSQEKLVDKLLEDTRAVETKYGGTEFSYEEALEPHKALHGEIFNRVELDLGASEETRSMTNEELIEAQKRNTASLMPAMLERMFYNGRYANICSSGIQAPRLGGIWTGAWRVQWSGDYTTDANINLQTAGNNIGAMPESTQGFISVMLKTLVDWQVNAKAFYNIDNALFAPTRTDGDRGTMFHFGSWPGEAWNSGSSWLIIPMYEYWQCYGNQQIPLTDELKEKLLSTENEYTYRDIDYPEDTLDYNLRNTLDLDQGDVDRIVRNGYFDLESDILYPMLEKTANFWKEFLTPEYYVNTQGEAVYDPEHKALSEGEKYLILPSYSPENYPSNAHEIAMNATMDISSTKDLLHMLITLDKKLKNGDNAEEWQQLSENLPEYVYESTGELKEWALEKYEENYNHRHISHLYGVWPGYESSNDVTFSAGAVKALETKNEVIGSNGAPEGHGWVHKALIGARLKSAASVRENLKPLLTGSMIYPSMMTSHNVDGGACYCTDTSITLPAIMLESLVYSDEGQVELLPAQMEEIEKKGSVTGIKTRSGGEIRSLEWSQNQVTAVIDAPEEVKLKLSDTLTFEKVTINGEDVTAQLETDDSDTRNIEYLSVQGENLTVVYTLSEVQEGYYSISDSEGFLNTTDVKMDSQVTKEVFDQEMLTGAVWKETEEGEGRIGLQNGKYSSRYLDLHDRSGEEGGLVQVWNEEPGNSSHRKFRLMEKGEYYQIQTVQREVNASGWSGSDKVFADSAGLVVYESPVEGNDLQLWKRIETVNGSIYENKGTGKWMYLSKDENSVAVTTVEKGALVPESQIWKLDYDYEKQGFKIISIQSGRVLNVEGNSLTQTAYQGRKSQLWRVEEDGIYSLSGYQMKGMKVWATADREVSYMPDTVKLSSEKKSLEVGEELQIQAAYTPEMANAGELEWKVISGTGSAHVDSTGLVTAQAAGTVFIEASLKADESIKDMLQLTVTGENIQFYGEADTDVQSWGGSNGEQAKNYGGSKYIRLLSDLSGTYGKYGEAGTVSLDSTDMKIGLIKFDVDYLKNKEIKSAKLVLTYYGKLSDKKSGNGTLAAMLTDTTDWIQGTGTQEGERQDGVTWKTKPAFLAATEVLSDSFPLGEKKSADDSSINGDKVTLDVTELLKSVPEEETYLSLGIFETVGEDMAFVSREGARMLGDTSCQPILVIEEENGGQQGEPNPVLKVSFDEENAKDESGNHSDGTVVGGPEFVEGINGKAIHFLNPEDRSQTATQYVDFGTPENLKFKDQDFSIAFWYQSSGSCQKEGAIISNKDWSSGDNAGFNVGDMKEGINWNFNTVESVSKKRVEIGRYPAATDGTWHHVTAVADRTSQVIRLYIDGVEAGNKSTKGWVGTVDVKDFILGADGVKKRGVEDACVDELYVYKEALTKEAVRELMLKDEIDASIAEMEEAITNILPGGRYPQSFINDMREKIRQAKITLAGNLTLNEKEKILTELRAAYEDFLEGVLVPVLSVNFDGENAQDNSGNGNHGTVVGSPEFTEGVKGKAIHFLNPEDRAETASQYVNFGQPEDLQFGTKSFSIMFWYKADGSITKEGSVISNKNWSSGDNAGFNIGDMKEGLNLNFNTVNSGKGRAETDRFSGATDNSWHHVAAVIDRKDKNQIILYFDGKEATGGSGWAGTKTNTADISGYTSTVDVMDFVLGADGEKKRGVEEAWVDELYVYKTAVTQEFIQSSIQDDFWFMEIDDMENQVANAQVGCRYTAEAIDAMTQAIKEAR